MKILTTLIDLATTFLHALEAEGRMLKRAVMNLAWAIALVGVASFLVLIAAGFFLAGIYQYLAAHMSPAAASLIATLPALLLALVSVGIAKWWTTDRQ